MEGVEQHHYWIYDAFMPRFSPYKLEHEAFAHFFEAYARNDKNKLSILNQMFPNAIRLFYKMIGGM